MVHRKRDLERARTEHDAGVDPDDPHHDPDTYVRTRVEDHSWWAHAGFLLGRYWPLWAPLTGLFAAFGFVIVTPKRTVQELRVAIDSNAAANVAATRRLQSQIDTGNAQRERLQQQHENLEDAVTALVRLGCVDPFLSKTQKVLSGVVDNAGRCIR